MPGTTEFIGAMIGGRRRTAQWAISSRTSHTQLGRSGHGPARGLGQGFRDGRVGTPSAVTSVWARVGDVVRAMVVGGGAVDSGPMWRDYSAAAKRWSARLDAAEARVRASLDPPNPAEATGARHGA